jgi:prevent-host-death family protein
MRGNDNHWALQDAKNRLSELVRQAREGGPQTITVHGRAAVVVVAASEFERLRRRPRGSLAEFFRRSPLSGANLDLERDRDTGRDTPL